MQLRRLGFKGPAQFGIGSGLQLADTLFRQAHFHTQGLKRQGRFLQPPLQHDVAFTRVQLAQGMRQVSETPVTYFQTIDAMVKGLDDILQPGDVLLTLGAGTITRVGPAWLEGGKDA